MPIPSVPSIVQDYPDYSVFHSTLPERYWHKMPVGKVCCNPTGSPGTRKCQLPNYRNFFAADQDKSMSYRETNIFSRMLCPGAAPAYFFFFFQAEDGIRDLIVTGVQTCD